MMHVKLSSKLLVGLPSQSQPRRTIRIMAKCKHRLTAFYPVCSNRPVLLKGSVNTAPLMAWNSLSVCSEKIKIFNFKWSNIQALSLCHTAIASHTTRNRTLLIILWASMIVVVLFTHHQTTQRAGCVVQNSFSVGSSGSGARIRSSNQ